MTTLFINQYTENAKSILGCSTDATSNRNIVIIVHDTDTRVKPYVSTTYIAIIDKKMNVIETSILFNDDYSRYFPFSKQYKNRFGDKIPVAKINRIPLKGDGEVVDYINSYLNLK